MRRGNGWVWPTLLTGAVTGLLALTRKPDRFVGDLARKGDEIVVPVTALSLPGGGVLPGNIGSVGLAVTAATDPDLLSGLPVSIYTAAGRQTVADAIPGLPQLLGTQTVRREAVSAVFRNGKALTL